MKKLAVMFLGFICSASTSVLAHAPFIEGIDFTEETSLRLPYPIETSIAVYSYFQSSNDVDSTTFTLSAAELQDQEKLVIDPQGVRGRLLHVGTLIPKCEVYEGILPTLAVVGPVQENLPSYQGPLLPFPVAEGEGVFLLTNSSMGSEFYERFTQKTYWWQQKRDIALTRPGFYRIFVWEPSGRIGDYILEIGKQESFSSAVLQRSRKLVPYIKEDKVIHNPDCILN
jgi:hypothetical protein